MSEAFENLEDIDRMSPRKHEGMPDYIDKLECQPGGIIFHYLVVWSLYEVECSADRSLLARLISGF